MSAVVIPLRAIDDAYVELDASPMSGTSRYFYFLEVVRPDWRLTIGGHETIEAALDHTDRLRRDGVRVFETRRMREAHS